MLPMKSSQSSTAKARALSPASSVQYLKGVGPAKALALQKKGIFTLNDILYFFPLRYEDRRRLCTPQDLIRLEEGSSVTVLAEIQRVRDIPLRGKKQMLLEAIASADGALLTLTWFRSFPGLKEKLQKGGWTIIQGILKKYRGAPQIVHPELEYLSSLPQDRKVPATLHWGRVVPLYSRFEKISQRSLRELTYGVLRSMQKQVRETLPEDLRKRLSLPALHESLWEMHFPSELPKEDPQTTEDLTPAVRRLIFEEFFRFQLVLLKEGARTKNFPGLVITPKGKMAQLLRKALPYGLTNAQERAIADVLGDLQRPTAMNRIVQGDVGSGKTNVAFFSALECIENGFQVALMAPTEVLAEQHYENAKKFLSPLGINVALLVGSKTRSEKEELYAGIGNGSLNFIVGTHALIQEKVPWKTLSLVVIDEQHRFGVKQRAALRERHSPHILTMTATPIPRSLALTVFGELSVSTIDELPPGRQEIVTKALSGKERSRVYNLIRQEAEHGRQIYIVYPLVEDSDKEGMERVRSAEAEFQRLKAGPLQGISMALVHGQMPQEERNSAMLAFKRGEFSVLVATTVIEVGVDVPNATVMIVENAERFGLSQLHQLRGRVGRGQWKSYCVLVTESPPPEILNRHGSEEGVEEESPWVRLRLLEKTRSGFELSEADLRLRGPGDFFGTKQSGSPTFRLADLSRDQKLLESARMEAESLLFSDPDLAAPEHQGLRLWFDEAAAKAAGWMQSG
jgi:ATP-dependent DNA helicase RecG